MKSGEVEAVSKVVIGACQKLIGKNTQYSVGLEANIQECVNEGYLEKSMVPILLSNEEEMENEREVDGYYRNPLLELSITEDSQEKCMLTLSTIQEGLEDSLDGDEEEV